MKYIPLIIILLLILAILVLIFYGVYRVKRFSRQLFGTDDILQGVKKAQEDLSTTPRSVSERLGSLWFSTTTSRTRWTS